MKRFFFALALSLSIMLNSACNSNNSPNPPLLKTNYTSTPIYTPTITLTATITLTPTITRTPTITATPSITNTHTFTNTITKTPTSTATFTTTLTDTPTMTLTPTITGTPTITLTPTATCVGSGSVGDTTDVGSFGVNNYMDAWQVSFSASENLNQWQVKIDSLPSQYTVALFTDDGSTYPGTQVSGTYANVTATETGWNATAISPSVNVLSGNYWIGIWSGNASGAIVGAGYTTGVDFYVISESSFPSTFPSGATNDNEYFGPMAVVLNYCP